MSSLTADPSPMNVPCAERNRARSPSPASPSSTAAESVEKVNLCKGSELLFERDSCWVERKLPVGPGHSKIELQYGALREPRLSGLTPGVKVRCRRSIARDLSATVTLVDGKLKLTPAKVVADRTATCEIDNPHAVPATVRATADADVFLGLRLNLVERRCDGERVTFAVEPELTATNSGSAALDTVHPQYLMAPAAPDAPPDVVAGGEAGGAEMLQLMLGGGAADGAEKRPPAQGALEASARISSGKIPFPLGDTLVLGAKEEVNIPFHTDRLSELTFEREHVMGIPVTLNPRVRKAQQLVGYAFTDYVLSATPVALPPTELIIQGRDGPCGSAMLAEYTERGLPLRISAVRHGAITGEGKVTAAGRESRRDGDAYSFTIDFAVQSTDPEEHKIKLRFDLAAFNGIDKQPITKVGGRELKDRELVRWDAGDSMLEITVTAPGKAAGAQDPTTAKVNITFDGQSVIPSGAMGTDQRPSNYV